jgi:hypothetical protein
MRRDHRYAAPQYMECLLFCRGPRKVNASVAPVSPMLAILATSCMEWHAGLTVAVVAF